MNCKVSLTESNYFPHKYSKGPPGEHKKKTIKDGNMSLICLQSITKLILILGKKYVSCSHCIFSVKASRVNTNAPSPPLKYRRLIAKYENVQR